MGKGLVLRKVTLKNVLTPTGERDIEAQVVPFDRRKDEHTDFAYAYIDMLGRMPSEFRNMSDASKAYVRQFMVHKAEDEKNPESDFACVLSDTRAARTLLNTDETQQEFHAFFENA